MINPWALLAVAVAIAAAAAGGYVKGRADESAARLELQLEQSEDMRRLEQARTRMAQGIEDAKNRDLRRTAVRLADALERLSNRPDRLPEPARPACAGATGAELARPDAAFLERYAAIARGFQVRLAACEAREVVPGVVVDP